MPVEHAGLINGYAGSRGMVAQPGHVGQGRHRSAVAQAGEAGDPGMIANPRLAIRTTHLFQQGRGGRIIAEVVKGLDLRMAFHVGLAGEDEDLQRLGRGA